MKKLLVLFLAVLFVAPSVFAQKPFIIKEKERAARYPRLEENTPEKRAYWAAKEKEVLALIETLQDWEDIVYLRSLWGKQEKENVSHILQNIVFMADNFIRDYAKNPQANTFDGFEPKNEAAVRRVVAQIEKPIMTRWDEEMVVSEYIQENLDEVRGLWMSEEPITYLEDFREILVKYSQPQYSKEGKMVLGYLESYRRGIKGMKDLNSSHLVQSTVSLMDVFMPLVKQNPAEAKRLAREIVKPVKAGWFDREVDVFYIITNHACEVWQVEDKLESFAETLKELNK